MGQRMIRRQVDEGLQLYTEKNYENAIKKWTVALQKMKDNRLRFSTLNYLALASRDRGRNKDYLVYAVQQIDVAHEVDDNHLRAQAYFNLSRANEILADYFKAVGYSRSVLQYSSAKDPMQGYAFLVMAESYIGLSNFAKVLECLDRAWTIANEQLDRVMEIEALTVMSKVYMLFKDFRKALAFQRRAHELALSSFAENKGEALEKLVQSTKLFLAIILRLLGHYDEASKWIEETMRAASSLADRPVQAKCLVCLGDIQRSQKNNEVACKKYEAAIQMLQEMSDRSNSALAMLALVKSLLALDTQKQMANEILNNALSTATNAGNKLMQARCHIVNQRLLTANSDFGKAQQASEAAHRLFQEADLICSICQLPIGYQPDDIQFLTCNHFYHQRCVQSLVLRWTSQAQTCPKCQKNVLFTRSYIALCCT